MTKEELEKKVLELENEIEKIKKRNTRVEGDKSRETSLIRKIFIIIFTYIFALLYLKVADTTNPFLWAIVPCLGFYLSTLSLKFIRKKWESKK